jgi:hypothetical protein
MSLQQYWTNLSFGISSLFYNKTMINILSTIDRNGYEKLVLSMVNHLCNLNKLNSDTFQNVHLMSNSEFGTKISDLYSNLLEIPFLLISKYQIIGFISEKWSENHKEFIELYKKTSDRKEELLCFYIKEFLGNFMLETIKEALERSILKNDNTDIKSINELINKNLESINFCIDVAILGYENDNKTFTDLKNSIRE